MDKVRVYYDAVGHTLSVWVDDPALEHVCEELSDDTIIMKDVTGRMIGFEQLHVTLSPTTGLVVEVSNPTRVA